MAVLQDMIVVAPDTTTADITIDDIKGSIARQFWAWYYLNQEHVIIKRRILWVGVTVRVRDLYPVFEMLFGHPDGE